MPKYTVTDPSSGRSVTLEGDSPPSEVEIEQVFSSLTTTAAGAQAQPAEQAQPVVAEQPAQVKPTGLPNPMADLATGVSDISASTSAAATDISKSIDWLSEKIPKSYSELGMAASTLVGTSPSDLYDLAVKAAKVAVPLSIRMAPPVALGLMTRQPTTIGTAARQSAGIYPANVLAENLAQYAEYGMGVGPRPSKESVKASLGKAIAPSAPMYGGPLRSAASQALGTVAGSLAETGNLPKKQDVMISGTLGFTGGLFDSFGRATGRNVANLEETSGQFGALGISMSDIPGHYLTPGVGAASYRRTAVSGSRSAEAEANLSRRMIEAAQRNIADASQVRAGGDIAADLGLNLQDLNRAELAACASSTEAASAQAAVNRAQTALNQANASADDLARGQSAQALQKAREELNLVLAKDVQEAAALFASGVTRRGLEANPTNMKGYWEEHIASRLEAYKDSQASLRYSQQSLGFAPDAPLIRRSDVVDAVTEARRDLGASGIEIPTLNLGDNEMLSLNDVRAIRRQVSGGASFDAPAAERRIYAAIGDRIAAKTRASVQRLHGEESLSNLDAANNWYRSIYEATDNPLGRSLFGRVVNDDAVSRLAGNMVKGKDDEYRSAVSYINSVTDGNPILQSAMTKRLNSIVREKLISDSSKLAGAGLYQIDANDLLTNLGRVSRTGRFNVEDLGFGNAEQLREIRTQLNRFGGMDRLSSSELAGLFSEPQIENALRMGGGLSAPVRSKVADMAAKRRAYSSAVSAATGNQALAARELAEANRLFAVSGQTSAAATNHLAQLNQSPLIQALSAGRGEGGRSFGLIGSQGEDFNSFIGYMMNSAVGRPAEKRALMNALQAENPLLRQEISHRYLMNLFDDLSRNTTAGVDTARKLDYGEMDKMFRPLFEHDTGSESSMMRTLLGEDAFNNLSRMAQPVRRLAQAERSLKGAAGYEAVATPVGIGTMVASGRLTGTFSQRNALKLIVDTYRDLGQHVTSFFYRNPTAFEAYRRTGQISTALGSLGSQAMARELTINPELRQEAAKLEERNKQAQKSPQ